MVLNQIVNTQVPSSQRRVYFAWNEADGREPRMQNKAIFKSRDLSSFSSTSDERKFFKHTINFLKIWTSEQESKGRCTLCKKQVLHCLACLLIAIFFYSYYCYSNFYLVIFGG